MAEEAYQPPSHLAGRLAVAGASVFYIFSQFFIEEKETLRVIYLRTISVVGATVKSILNSSLMSGIMPLASLLLFFYFSSFVWHPVQSPHQETRGAKHKVGAAHYCTVLAVSIFHSIGSNESYI